MYRMKKRMYFALLLTGLSFSAIIVCVATACGHKTDIDKHSEAYIRQRIDSIYKAVIPPAHDKGEEALAAYMKFNRDSAYCSERYYALMKEAQKLCEERDEVLYDADYWLCGQDWADDWNYKVKKVYQITDSTALVDMLIHNFSDQETTIALRFERDDWYIDDFSPSADGHDDKAYLRGIVSAAQADGVEAPPADLSSVEAVEADVRKMYERRNQMVEAGSINLGDLDKAFCTSYYLGLKRNIAKHDEHATGDMRFFGDETGERWLTGAFAPLEIESIKAELLSGDQAKATVRFKIIDKFADYMKDVNSMTLFLWLENGHWRINNFEQPNIFYEEGYLGMMESYARKNKIPTE